MTKAEHKQLREDVNNLQQQMRNLLGRLCEDPASELKALRDQVHAAQGALRVEHDGRISDRNTMREFVDGFAHFLKGRCEWEE